MPKTTTAVVNSEIILEGASLPDTLVEDIIHRLTILNVAKEEAEENNESGWKDMPDFLELWRIEDEHLIVPRGFIFDLHDVIEEHGFELDWKDERRLARGFRIGNEIPLEPEQVKIVEAIVEFEQGILKAPTGAGKTVAMLEIFNRFPGGGIVIVNTKEIASQWMQRCEEWLGPQYPVSLIGDGHFEIARHGLTVAIQGTLWSRRDSLRKEGFFDRFVVVALDECHHATARTYNEIVSEFSSQILIGGSATPMKTGEFELAKAVLGPVVVEVTEEEVEKRIIKPKIEVIETKLGVEAGQKKKRGKGKKVAAWARRRDYETLIKKLTRDKDRTDLIAEEIMLNHFENANLVLSRRIEHLAAIYDALEEKGFPKDRLLAMAGQHSLKERNEAIACTEDANCVLLTTLGDEAMDAPRLDRCHLAFPSRNIELILQQIGRIRRRHPRKKDAIVIDYCDMQVETFYKQYLDRRNDLYNDRGFVVVKRKVSDPHRVLN